MECFEKVGEQNKVKWRDAGLTQIHYVTNKQTIYQGREVEGERWRERGGVLCVQGDRRVRGAVPVGSSTEEESGRPSGIGSCSALDSQTPSAGSAGSPAARAGRGSDSSGSSCPSDRRRTDQWVPP